MHRCNVSNFHCFIKLYFQVFCKIYFSTEIKINSIHKYISIINLKLDDHLFLNKNSYNNEKPFVIS